MSLKKADKLVRDLASDGGLKEEASTDSSLSLDGSDLDRALKAREVQEKDEAIKDQRQDREQRKVFSSRIFVFMCAYMGVAIIIVFLCGCRFMTLDDSVLITLLTTTLANVIGVFNFVAKYLFHK